MIRQGSNGWHNKQSARDLRDPRALPCQEKLAGLGFRRYCVLLAELVDSTAGIDDFLLARVEGVAIGANLDLQILADGRASLELIAAGTGDRDDFIIWMNAGFHGNLECR
jgi:hypothetical protein